MDSQGEEENPFTLPPDDEIFTLREQERKKRAEERERDKHLKVHQKTTSASRIHRIKRFKDDEVAEKKDEEKQANVFLGPGAATVGRDTRREKENIADFVAKKREMFLVQMSLDVKRAEILKLDEKARMKEEALRKSQQMLGEDVDRFDRFLQANDAKAHRTMKQAEDMTKEKQQRLQKIKTAKGQISAIQSDISKHKEQKEECIKYKQFLDKLTPGEWKERQIEIKKERRKKRKEDWVAGRIEQIQRQMQNEIDAEEAEMDKDADERQRKGGKRGKAGKKAEEDEQRERERELELRRRKIRKKFPTQDQLEKKYMEEMDCDSGEEIPLYFQDPKDLLDIFTALEEQNLFLIQNSQETEQQLEEIEQKFQEAKHSQEHRQVTLKDNIVETEKKINEETEKAEELRGRIGRKTGTDGTAELLKELEAKTRDVYKTCDFNTDHFPGALQMLADIERKLEELLTHLEQAERAAPETFHRLEFSKEKDRREKVRQQRTKALQQKNEERLRASLLRSQAPVHKKTGKQIMFRSAPLHQEKRVVRENDDDAEAEQAARLFGIYVGRDGNPHAAKPQAREGS